MTIITPCGNPANEADCQYCLQMQDCREAREAICRGCRHEYGPCTSQFKRKRADAGMCRGRELVAMAEITRLHGKGDF